MKFRFSSGEEDYVVDLEDERGGYRALVDGSPVNFELISEDEGLLTLRFGDEVKTLYWAVEGEQCWIAYEGCTYLLEKPGPGTARRHARETSQENVLRAPMPAQVREVLVQPGEVAEAGATLLVLEAMKMEILLRAPRRAIIEKVHVSLGESVDRDQVLIDLEEPQG